MLGHRAGVAPLAQVHVSPLACGLANMPRLEEALDAGHGQLHPPYARWAPRASSTPSIVKLSHTEGVSRLAIASDHLSAALDHCLDGIIRARWREGHSQRGGHYQTGWWRRRCPQRARLSQAEDSPATADLIR